MRTFNYCLEYLGLSIAQLPRPRRSYVVRVQARYAGGDGLGGGWSADLSRSFQTAATWRSDGATLPAPQLVPEPAALARATQAQD